MSKSIVINGVRIDESKCNNLLWNVIASGKVIIEGEWFYGSHVGDCIAISQNGFCYSESSNERNPFVGFACKFSVKRSYVFISLSDANDALAGRMNVYRLEDGVEKKMPTPKALVYLMDEFHLNFGDGPDQTFPLHGLRKLV